MNLLNELSVAIGADIDTLLRIIRTAPKRYKVYEIDKRNGGKRTIAHPARELKEIQRFLLKNVFQEMPVSEIAMAYVGGRGILANAQMHQHSDWILKLDFKDFFHSIRPSDFSRTVRRMEKSKIELSDLPFYHKILFWEGNALELNCLSIGAPTSPIISNLVCVRLDAWMIEQATKANAIVTRYADDITVSGDNPNNLWRFKRKLESVLTKNKGLTLRLNEKKTGIYGRGERRMVTGLIITPDQKISLGRERKREISALVHRFSIGTASPIQAFRAKGLLSFAHAVEPSFAEALSQKYGENVIAELKRYEVAEVYEQDYSIELF